jgi:hypothetical protein
LSILPSKIAFVKLLAQGAAGKDWPGEALVLNDFLVRHFVTELRARRWFSSQMIRLHPMQDVESRTASLC